MEGNGALGDDLDIGNKRISLHKMKWQYRGEGNANLVLSLPNRRLIIRLRKHDTGNVAEAADEGKDTAILEALFCKAVISPHLGEAFIQPPSIAYLEVSEVSYLERTLHMHRPIHRHHKGLRRCYAMVYPDYALLPRDLSVDDAPTYCVEVKPKQGWIPEVDRRLSRCTFCLNQYLKLKKGSIRTPSMYCPLDLFSGNLGRMTRALRALLAVPQNNLKIFRDGVVVYGDEMGEDLYQVLQSWLGDHKNNTDLPVLVERLCGLVLEALTRDLCMADIPDWGGGGDEGMPEDFPLFQRVPSSLLAGVAPLLPGPACDWASEPLADGCILARVLRMQKLDRSGADLVYSIYRSSGPLPDYGYVSDLVKGGAPVDALHRYLLATTAKDCSVMVAFQQVDATVRFGSKHLIRCSESKSYVFNIGVSDLDPKPVSCIEKHRKRDCEILTSCLELLRK